MIELLIFIITAIVIMYSTKNFVNYQMNEEQDYLKSMNDTTNTIQPITQQSNISQEQAGLIVAILSKLLFFNTSHFSISFFKSTCLKISEYFDDKNEILDIFENIYENESKSDVHLIDFIHQYYQSTDFQYDKRMSFVNYILILVYLNGTREQLNDILTNIYKTLRISQSDFDNSIQLIEQAINDTQKMPYELELSNYDAMMTSVIPHIVYENINDNRLIEAITILYPLSKYEVSSIGTN